MPDPEPFDYPTEPSSSTGWGHIFTEYIYPGLYVQTIDFEPTYADATALERDYGFTPKITLREGLRHFAEWYKAFYG